MARPMPFSSETSLVSAAWTREPALRKARPFMREWLNTWRNRPVTPYAVPEERPMSM